MVYGPKGQVTEGHIVSSDLRMECVTEIFSGSQDEILYRFDARGMEVGEEVRGSFHVISNHGEYYLPFTVSIVPEVIDSSLGSIKNLFHFTNLAKSCWEEAVKLFIPESSRRCSPVMTGSTMPPIRGCPQCRAMNIIWRNFS